MKKNTKTNREEGLQGQNSPYGKPTDKKKNEKWSKRPVWLNIGIGLDQLGNTILPLLPWPLTWPGVGNPDKTISYTLGQLQAHHKGRIPWRYPTARIIAWALDKIDPDHCASAYENGT